MNSLYVFIERLFPENSSLFVLFLLTAFYDVDVSAFQSIQVEDVLKGTDGHTYNVIGKPPRHVTCRDEQERGYADGFEDVKQFSFGRSHNLFSILCGQK
jgi:hypothetical protein